jgi:SRSO17 transposase
MRILPKQAMRAAVDREVPAAPVLVAAYGKNIKFREGISDLGLLYVVGVQSSTLGVQPGQGPYHANKKESGALPPYSAAIDAITHLGARTSHNPVFFRSEDSRLAKRDP